MQSTLADRGKPCGLSLVFVVTSESKNVHIFFISYFAMDGCCRCFNLQIFFFSAFSHRRLHEQEA